jgi:ABC-type multidrug transport system fused ATPase/permease subunit/pSer/pThr/pTyr-binding forkhead associated (FHA) protein
MRTLIVMNGLLAGRRIEIGSELVLGRENADLSLGDERASRRHAAVRPVPGGLEIEDLGSLNGTWVNGGRTEGPTRLMPGDIVELGQTVIQVEAAQSALVVRGGPLAGRRIEIGAELVIGRENADLSLEDEKASRRHAAVRPVPGGLEIEDLGSLNGTWVNGGRIGAPTRLAPGDTVTIGDVLIDVVSDAEVERPAARTQVEARLTVAATIAWRTYSGKGVTVHAPDGSYAATVAPVELHEAEGALAALEELLQPEPERRTERLDVFLTDGFADLTADGVVTDGAGGGAGARAGAIGWDAGVRVVQPEAPGEPMTWLLTRMLFARWFSPGLSSSALFHAGIAGVVAAQTGAGPSIDEVRERIREQLASEGSVSIFATSKPDGGSQDESSASAGPTIVATSFVAFLLDTYGPGALRQFLAQYDPERRDQAAIAAFERSLAALEEAWLASLEHVAGSRAAFGTFMRCLLPFIRPYWRRWLEIGVYMLFTVAFTIALPFAFRYLFDTVIPDRRTGTLVVLILALFAGFLLNALVDFRRTYASSWVSQNVLMSLQQQMFDRLQQLPHAFFARAKIGDLMSRLSHDLDAVQKAMTAILTQGIFLIVQAIAAAVAALYLSWFLGLLVLVVVPLFTFSYLALLSRIQQASKQAHARFGEVMTATQESLSAQPVIKAFGLEQRTIAAYRARLEALFKAILRFTVLSSVFNASVDMAITVGQLLVLGMGGYLVIDGQITLGTLVAFVALLPSFFQPITALASVGQTIQNAAGAMERVLEVLEEPIDIEDRPGAPALTPLQREIRLEGVTFSYDGERPILRGLDVTIPAGKHVAIVGPSGSGKSTIVNLVLRFWDPDEGRVLFDGHNAREVTLASLRGQIGLVFQDTFIFDTTLRENIGIGRPEASDAEVAAAAHAAQLDAYVESLPAGLDTVLGERGVRMSGGQRQRLAIARALVRNPSVLVLDEATSALDAQTEREILDTLAVLARDRTTISITHRLSMAAIADRILVLEQGRMVEEGTHAELVEAGGLYQRLYEEQMGRATVERLPHVALDAARLRTIPLFAKLGGDELAGMAELLTLERYGPDEEVVRQGERGDKLYLIVRGQVEVVANDRAVKTLNEGEFFGELALLTNEPRIATIRTTMPTDLYGLARADFESLAAREPDVRQVVAATLAGRRGAHATAHLATQVAGTGIAARTP